ncbi:unnamed protein product [Ectocarpus sp. 4 AP-2014]
MSPVLGGGGTTVLHALAVRPFVDHASSRRRRGGVTHRDGRDGGEGLHGEMAEGGTQQQHTGGRSRRAVVCKLLFSLCFGVPVVPRLDPIGRRKCVTQLHAIGWSRRGCLEFPDAPQLIVDAGICNGHPTDSPCQIGRRCTFI